MKAFFKFTSVGFVKPALGFLLLPLYLNYIPVEEYGILTILTAFFAIFGSFSFLKSDMAMRTLFFDFKNKKDQRSLFHTLFGFQISLSIIWICLFLVLGESIFEFIFSTSINYMPYGLLFTVSVFLGGANSLYLIYIQNQKRANLYSNLILFSALTQITAQAVLILVFKQGILGYLYGSILSQTLVLLYILSQEKSIKLFQFRDHTLVKSLRFSVHFIPFLILLTMEQNIHKFMLERFSTIELVAVFGVLLSLSNLVVLTNNIFDNSIRPYLYEYLSSPDETTPKEAKRLTRLYFDLLSFVLVGLFGLGNFIPLLIEPEQYQNIPEYMSLLCLSLAPYVLVRYFALILIHQKKTSLLNKVYFIKLIVMGILFYLLIPKYGIEGILLVLILSNSLNAILFYWSVREELNDLLDKKYFYLSILSISLLSFSLILDQVFYLRLFSVFFMITIAAILLKNNSRYLRKQILSR